MRPIKVQFFARRTDVDITLGVELKLLSTKELGTVIHIGKGNVGMDVLTFDGNQVFFRAVLAVTGRLPRPQLPAEAGAPEQIAHAAGILKGAKQRTAVFEAIYYGKKQVKKVSEIAGATRLPSIRVLQEGRRLATAGRVTQIKIDGETAYKKDDFFSGNKAKVLSLARNPSKLKTYPTKRNPAGTSRAVIRLPASVRYTPPRRISIDDTDSFARARNVRPEGNLPATVSEAKFKKGVQRILGQGGSFKDWGGERNDLFSTRLRIAGRRLAAAFGFKGPGTKGKLTPGKMGKNGDQILRLFDSPADVFFVQYWADVDESVYRQMEAQAIAQALKTGGRVHYGVIDGQDSMRLYAAYRSYF